MALVDQRPLRIIQVQRQLRLIILASLLQQRGKLVIVLLIVLQPRILQRL